MKKLSASKFRELSAHALELYLHANETVPRELAMEATLRFVIHATAAAPEPAPCPGCARREEEIIVLCPDCGHGRHYRSSPPPAAGDECPDAGGNLGSCMHCGCACDRWSRCCRDCFAKKPADCRDCGIPLTGPAMAFQRSRCMQCDTARRR